MIIDWLDFLGGCVGGAIGLTLAQPLDTIKTRIQVKKRPLINSIKHLYNHEGILGFYRGYFFPLITTGLNNAAFFGVSNAYLHWTDKDPQKKTDVRDRSTHDIAVAAMYGAFAQVLIACPVETVKVRQQVQKTQLSAMRVLKRNLDRGGIKGLYRALNPMLCSDIIANMLYVQLYEDFYFRMAGEREPAGTGRNLLLTVLAGGFAGMMAFVPMVPFDVATTRLMADNKNRYKGMVHVIQESVKEDGIRVLYKGAGIIAIRSFPMYGGTFLGFELTKQLYRKFWQRD